MKNSATIAGMLAVTLAGAAVFFLIKLPDSIPGLSPGSTKPQEQTERLTSFFLLRRIEKMRNKAVYLQHKEEGRKLLDFISEMIE